MVSYCYNMLWAKAEHPLYKITNQVKKKANDVILSRMVRNGTDWYRGAPEGEQGGWLPPWYAMLTCYYESMTLSCKCNIPLGFGPLAVKPWSHHWGTVAIYGRVRFRPDMVSAVDIIASRELFTAACSQWVTAKLPEVQAIAIHTVIDLVCNQGWIYAGNQLVPNPSFYFGITHTWQ